MSDLDDIGLLLEVVTSNAPGWTSAQRDEITAAAGEYLARSVAREQLAARVRAVAPGSGPDSSWSVFATWLVRRAGRLGQYLRDARP